MHYRFINTQNVKNVSQLFLAFCYIKIKLKQYIYYFISKKTCCYLSKQVLEKLKFDFLVVCIIIILIFLKLF